MPTIEVDFETFKEITRRRPSESVTEGDIVKEALGLPAAKTAGTLPFWESEGAKFTIGECLEHKFRDGRLATAKVTTTGLDVEGKIYAGLSPAAVAVTHHQVNGWLFWYVRDESGRLVTASSRRPNRTDS